jgi:alkanesulfonate monooxygenase SsuD/methylene tetrahydromethanopterin reductase-like flavin-dependent oxidoreductase (luciferase family)
VLASLPVCVTDRAGAVRERAAEVYARYGELPSYRAILDREGGVGPADVALIGDEEEVSRGLRALAEAGATDFAASVFAPQGEDPARTYALLQRYAEAGSGVKVAG